MEDPVAAVAVTSSPPPDSSFSPVGSPETLDPHLDEVPRPSDEHSSRALTTSDNLNHKIVKQVEYYFSDENLRTDNFLMSYLTKDKHGFGSVMAYLSNGKLRKEKHDWRCPVSRLDIWDSMWNFCHAHARRVTLSSLPLESQVQFPVHADMFGHYVICGFEVVDVNELEIDYIKVASLAFNQLKMKKLARERSVIVAALKDSSLLVVSSDEKKVKRLHPLPFTEVKDPQLCTVLVENLPEDHSTENIRKIFGEAGNIKNICVRDPDAVRLPRKGTIEEKLLSGKLHALVEFETVEAAEKAVATLNDEQDWRYGMRVKFLKRMSKRELKKKSLKGPDSEKSSSARESDLAVDVNHVNVLHDDTPNGEHGEHLTKDKNGHRGGNRGRGRKQKYYGSNGQGHGTVSFNHASETCKPPPGPRMPDGTRGFTMGRGRSLPSDPN
ncbi:hypothetical protein RJ639_036768 [Escallonia herrerae]|uniref:La-related protein 6A n=1 Tax=Escallonia herrerae TaxID=1293975 RepID=A0AA88WTZ5_9ASTE|nr:hypothetical protein RJ639_036768 [Escallonia herrerae]